MAFGFNSIKNPTPAKLVFWIRVYTVFAGSTIGALPGATWIPHIVSDISSSLLGWSLAVANGIMPLFGVKIDQSEIPKEQVKVIDTDTAKLIFWFIAYNAILYSL